VASLKSEKYSFFNAKGKVHNPTRSTKIDGDVAHLGRKLDESGTANANRTKLFGENPSVAPSKKANLEVIHRGWLRFGKGLTDARQERISFGAKEAEELAQEAPKAAPTA